MQTSSQAPIGNAPTITVCVCTYNQKQYIVDCLESIVTQETEFAYEILVGDDASTDGTSEIVADYARRFADRVVYIRHPVNIGPFQNFTEIHNLARGQFVAHIDGDDLMRPGKLQAQAKFLSENPDFSVVWHRVDVFNDRGDSSAGERQDLSAFDDGVVHLEQAIRLGCVAMHSSCMYRNSARKTRVADRQRLDTYLAWEYLSSGPGKIMAETLGAYRANSSTSMQRTFDTKRISVANAREFLSQHPEQRSNVVIFAFCNLLMDFKNRRPTTRDWLQLIRDCKTIPGPLKTLRTLFAGRKFKIPRLD